MKNNQILKPKHARYLGYQPEVSTKFQPNQTAHG
jgi:hypothetical protein